MEAAVIPAETLWRWLQRLAICAAALAASAVPAVSSADRNGDITPQAQYWIDASGKATIEQVAAGAAQLQPMVKQQAFALNGGALWLRFDLSAIDPSRRWYLLLNGGAFLDRASVFSQGPDGAWRPQHSGDHVPVAQWNIPHFAPVFNVPQPAGVVWMRLENQPAPTSPFVQLLSAHSLVYKGQWTYLLVGGYLGFGLLVFAVGLMHARLYGDRVFHSYCLYVACMLLFQLSFTGMGGLYFWPFWATFNDAAPGFFVLMMAGSGIWFIREATALPRYSRRIDRLVVGFSFFGGFLAVAYTFFRGPLTFHLLNLYGLLSVLVSISLCLWTWRKGERYSGWLFLGFLPIHLTYPFPALRSAGLIADSWLTQYAVLIGSAVEIPLLLYILHSRAKEFTENRARLRALDSTDPLTGLTIVPVLRLRLRDALRRARRANHRCTVLLVDLSNHAEIVASEGREAGDRALVVAASRLSQVVREVDTVCRVADTRFALLIEGPQNNDTRRLLAQHIVARGLEAVPQLPQHLTLRFRVVSVWVPTNAAELTPDVSVDDEVILQRLHATLDRLIEDPKRVVQHLESQLEAPVAQAA
jgi:two-component system, sensor histidine kinase LadS